MRNPRETEDICGCPLGLSFNPTTGDLDIADVYMGLLVLGPGGGLPTVIVWEVNESTLLLTNSLEVEGRSAVVHFINSSMRYQWRYESNETDRVLTEPGLCVSIHNERDAYRHYMAALLSGDRTGRLLKYERDCDNRTVVTVLLDGIAFANGIAFSEDGDSLLITEMTACRILTYWLKTPQGRESRGICRSPKNPRQHQEEPEGRSLGRDVHEKNLVITMDTVRSEDQADLAGIVLMDIIGRVQAAYTRLRRSAIAVRLSEDGEVAEKLHGTVGMTWRAIGEVEERDGVLWIGSVTMPFAGVFNIT